MHAINKKNDLPAYLYCLINALGQVRCTYEACMKPRLDSYISILTLILLIKLSLPHPFLTVNQSDNPMLFVHVNSQTPWKTVDPDQMASSEAIWSGSTLFSKAMPILA